MNDTPETQTTNIDPVRQALRKYVENFYDFQERRLQAQGRTLPKAKSAKIVLHEEDMLRLQEHVKELASAEKHALSNVAYALKRIPFYMNVLSDKVRYRGLGPTMAGVILSSFDIHREEMVSQLWSFAGLAPVPCFRCSKCKGELVTRKNAKGYFHVEDWYFSNNGCGENTKDRNSSVDESEAYLNSKSAHPVKGEKLHYNKWLRAKLCGVLGGCLIKSKSPWSKFYYDYKNRKMQEGWGRSDNHRHKAAIRYMIKMLLLDIWKEWRAHEGLSVRPSYQEQYLNHTHHASPQLKAYDIETTMEDLVVDEELALAEKDISELTISTE